MSSEAKKQSLADVLADTIRSIAGFVGVIGGLSYITGYLIVNFYLTQYGVANLSLVQSRYFATGALYLIVTVLICGAPLASIYTADQLSQTNQDTQTRRLMPVLIGASFLLAIAIIWMCGNLLVNADQFTSYAGSMIQRRYSIWMALPASGVAALFPFLVYYSLKRIFKSRALQLTSSDESVWIPATISILFVICFIISVFVFSRYAYASASPSVGGGAPIKVQLVLAQSLSGNQNFPLKNTDGTTEPVILIDHSGSELVILKTENNQVIELSDNQVISILH